MKIFVTVGTTAFDRLVEFVDKSEFFDAFDVTIQYGPGTYKPKKRTAFAFVKDILPYYYSANLVITHGGAGTIYKLLELSVPMCVVPNLDRCDKHQKDICQSLSAKGYLLYARDVSELCSCVSKFLDGSVALRPFLKESFFCSKEIADFILKN